MDRLLSRNEATKAIEKSKAALDAFKKSDDELKELLDKVPMRLDPVIADDVVLESQDLGDIDESIARDSAEAHDLVSRYAGAKKEREETLKRAEKALESAKSWEAAITKELGTEAQVPGDLDLLPQASNMIVGTALDIIRRPDFKMDDDLKQRMADYVAKYCRAYPELADASATQMSATDREGSVASDRSSRVESNKVLNLQKRLARSVSTRHDDAEKVTTLGQDLQEVRAEKIGLEVKFKEASRNLASCEAAAQRLREENTRQEEAIRDLHDTIQQQPTKEALVRLTEISRAQDDQIAALRADLEAATNEAKDHHSTVSKLALARTEISQLKTQLAALEVKSDDLSAARDALDEDNGKLNDLVRQRDDALATRDMDVLALRDEVDTLQTVVRLIRAQATQSQELPKLQQMAQRETAHANAQVEQLESDITALQLDLDHAGFDKAVVSRTPDALRVELEAERQDNARLRRDMEKARDSSQSMIERLCEAISQLPLSFDGYAAFFATLQECPATEAQSSQPQPQAHPSWTVSLPWLAEYEDAGDFDDFVRLDFRDALPIFVSLFATAKTGRTASLLGLHHLRALAKHLGVAVQTRVELVLFVLGAVVDECVAKGARCVYTCTAALVLWQIANTMQARWPSADVGKLRDLAQSHPLLQGLAQAIGPGTVEAFVGDKGYVSGSIGMLACPGGSIFVADTTKRMVWCAAKWRMEFMDPWRVEVNHPDGITSLAIHIDLENKRQVEWVADLELRRAGWRK
jgi:hypothetical protein